MQFKNYWLLGIKNSSKLKFYAAIKDKFEKEGYLDTVKNYYDRASFTKFRISAHRLQIELGRRNKTPKEQRICSWCHLTMSLEEIEDELHVFQGCDLYSKFRQDLINKTSKFLVTSTGSTPTIMDIIYLKVHKPDEMNTSHSASHITHAQANLDRLICRFINKSLRHRAELLDSIEQQCAQTA